LLVHIFVLYNFFQKYLKNFKFKIQKNIAKVGALTHCLCHEDPKSNIEND